MRNYKPTPKTLWVSKIYFLKYLETYKVPTNQVFKRLPQPYESKLLVCIIFPVLICSNFCLPFFNLSVASNVFLDL